MSYYFDYGATSLKKPKEVADKVYEVLSSGKYANASRGSYYEANNAFREVYEADVYKRQYVYHTTYLKEN